MVQVLSLFWSLLCCKLNLIPPLCSVAPPTFTPETTPSSVDQPPNYCCYFYTCLTFLPFFFSFLCLIRMSSPPGTPSFLLIFYHSLFSLFLPSGDAAKRKAWKLNRVASLRSIYANSLHNSEGKIKVEVADLWQTGGALSTPTPLTPPTARMEHVILEKWTSLWELCFGYLLKFWFFFKLQHLLFFEDISLTVFGDLEVWEIMSTNPLPTVGENIIRGLR